MKKIRSIFLLCLAITLLPLTIVQADGKTDGIVRVLLTKLNITDTVRLSLDGSYTISGISFQRGSDLVVSSKTGSLIVYYEGMAMNCGKTLTLQRHPVTDGKENGIRINDVYELHPGDLVISVKDGMLRLVLHAPVEEYLLGVVPYEMSDSFPLEALKAQAVTARTYALRKSGSSNDYDVVDNTNDQAYMGIRAEYTRAAQAIEETAGICGTYKGSLAECYYSASNGGQTELVHHVWGNGDYDYLRMYDDPYDLENPESVVMRASLPKKITNTSQLGALEHDILAQIDEPLTAKGFDSASGYQIRNIDSIELVSPKFSDSPSRIMTGMNMTLTVQGMAYEQVEEDVNIFILDDPAAYAAPEETTYALVPRKTQVTISLPIFNTVEDALKLSVNQTDNEIITVSETEDSFVFESRRYGHGVGMSQRGAQWMAAQYGWNYQQILNFYYPGMAVETYTYTHKMPDAVNNAFLATPGPPATPTPRPTAQPLTSTPAPGQTIATVANIGVNSYLNLRAQPSTSSDVLRQLYYGQKLILIKDLGEWMQVRMDDMEGYVMKEFLQIP